MKYSKRIKREMRGGKGLPHRITEEQWKSIRECIIGIIFILIFGLAMYHYIGII